MAAPLLPASPAFFRVDAEFERPEQGDSGVGVFLDPGLELGEPGPAALGGAQHVLVHAGVDLAGLDRALGVEGGEAPAPGRAVVGLDVAHQVAVVGADQLAHAEPEAQLQFAQGIDHLLVVGPVRSRTFRHLGDFVLVQLHPVETEEALAGGHHAVAFPALVDHGHVRHPDVAAGRVSPHVGREVGAAHGGGGRGARAQSGLGGGCQAQAQELGLEYPAGGAGGSVRHPPAAPFERGRHAGAGPHPPVRPADGPGVARAARLARVSQHPRNPVPARGDHLPEGVTPHFLPRVSAREHVDGDLRQPAVGEVHQGLDRLELAAEEGHRAACGRGLRHPCLAFSGRGPLAAQRLEHPLELIGARPE